MADDKKEAKAAKGDAPKGDAAPKGDGAKWWVGASFIRCPGPSKTAGAQ